MFRFSVLYSAKCLGDVGRTVYIHGLCEGRTSASDIDGNSDGGGSSDVLPVLIISWWVFSCTTVRGDVPGVLI